MRYLRYVKVFRATFETRQMTFARTFAALVHIERFTMVTAVGIGMSTFYVALQAPPDLDSRTRPIRTDAPSRVGLVSS